MPDLIMQAEQRLIAAMLARPHQRPDQQWHIEPQDFGHPTHRAIFEALLDIHEQEGHSVGEHDRDQLLDVVETLVNQPDVELAWLKFLANIAPDHEHALEYAKIVSAAAFDREVEGWPGGYEAAAGQTSSDEARSGLQRLSRAMHRYGEIFGQVGTPDPQQAAILETPQALPASQMHREDQVLADLLQRPEQVREVALWLTPDVFTSPQRRLTYETLVPIAFDGDPVDEVIVGWQVESAHRTVHYWGGETYQSDETDSAYVTRLAAADVAKGTAIIVGRELVAEHIIATTHLPAMQMQRGTPAHASPQWGLQPPLESAPTIQPRHLDL